MKKEMLINMSQSEECRIAIVEDNRLEELYVERASQDNYVGNIYKGKVVNMEPSIQAAFVDFGVGRNGFLHISDIEPQYYRQGGFDPERFGDDDRDEDGRRPDVDRAICGRASSRRFRRSFSAATKFSCKSSRKGSATRAPPSRRTSVFPGGIWC